MTKSPLKLSEIIALIKRSSSPNLIIEGKDDMRVFRKLKKDIGLNIQLIPCDGRDKLLQVYEKRNEFPDKVAIFIADKDMFVFDSKHLNYTDIVWTHGYSIENDLYVASNLCNCMLEDDHQPFRRLLSTLSNWFSFEVCEYLEGREHVVDVHSSRITKNLDNIDPDFITSRNVIPNQTIAMQINENPEIYFRGKNLFEALSRAYNCRKECSNMNPSQLFDVAYSYCDWEKMLHLTDGVRNKLA